MRNVPPNPANYAQRSGRAGRSGRTAAATSAATPLALVDKTEQLGPGVKLQHLKHLTADGWFDLQILTADLSNDAVSSDLIAGDTVTATGAISKKADKAGAVAAGHGASVRNGQLLKSAMPADWQHVGVGSDGIGRLLNMALDAKATLQGTEHDVARLNAPGEINGQNTAGKLAAYTPLWGAADRHRGLGGNRAEVLVRDGKVVSVGSPGAGSAMTSSSGLPGSNGRWSFWTRPTS